MNFAKVEARISYFLSMVALDSLALLPQALQLQSLLELFQWGVLAHGMYSVLIGLNKPLILGGNIRLVITQDWQETNSNFASIIEASNNIGF